MMPSFMVRKRSSSSRGRPSRVRKTCEGNGTENSLAKSTSPWSMKPSMRSLTRTRHLLLHGRHLARRAKIGSSSLRYFLCSGGSIWSGIIGRLFLRSTASMFDEKISGCRRASSMTPLVDRTTPVPSMAMTGHSSRRALNMACGLAPCPGPCRQGPPRSVGLQWLRPWTSLLSWRSVGPIPSCGCSVSSPVHR